MEYLDDMRRIDSYLLPLLLVTVLAVTGCGGGSEPSGAERPIKVGAIFDLTGPTSDVGTLYADGVRGYFDQLRANGGVEGREVELIYQDYGYKVDQAEQLYTQFVQEGAVAFLGWGTGDTEALRGRVAEDEIPFTSASYSHVLGNPAEAPYNFLVGTSYSDQFAIVLDWILENHGGDGVHVALMHHPSPFGRSPYEQGGRDYAAARGIELETHEMPRGATDYTAELTRIRESGAGYVVFQNTSGPVAVALKNARDLGLELGTYCLNWCTNEVLTELAGEAAEGVVGAVTFSPPSGALEGKGMVYGQGWTTAAVMTEGIRRVVARGEEVTGPKIKAALESLRDYDTGGVTVPISYSADDHLGARGMRLYEVREGSWRQLTDFRTAPDWGG